MLLGELSDLLSHDLDQPDADPTLTQYLALTLGAFRTLDAKSNTGQPIDPLVPLSRALSAKYRNARSGLRQPPAWPNKQRGRRASLKTRPP